MFDLKKETIKKNIFLILSIISGFIFIVNVILVIAIDIEPIKMITIPALIFFIVFMLYRNCLKAIQENTKSYSNIIKARTIDELLDDNNMSDYDRFVEWWSNVNENDIQSNDLTFGAYQVIVFYNEVCNGGFDQFWDYSENWNLDNTAKYFKTLLPTDIYKLYTKAYKTHLSGKDCEELNSQFDYEKIENQVLPEIAKKVMDYYRANRSTNN